jgi:hypothetical protein
VEYQRTNPDQERQAREISHLISEIQEQGFGSITTTTSFQKIKNILEFTAKANIPIVEENVREHISFFKELLDQLNEDLT